MGITFDQLFIDIDIDIDIEEERERESVTNRFILLLGT